MKWTLKVRLLCFLYGLMFQNIPSMLHIKIDGDILNSEKIVCTLINTAKSYPGIEKYVAIRFH